jgi:MFS family permease
MSGAAMFIGGFGSVVYNINQISFRQAITPRRMQGRMNATMRFIVWGTLPVGAMLGGFLGGTIGLHETIWVGALGGIVAFVPLLFAPLRSLKTMPDPIVDEHVDVASSAIDTDAEIVGEAVDESPRPFPGSQSPRVDVDDEDGPRG